MSSFQRLKVAGYSSVDPLALSEEHLSHDLSAVPRIGLYDIFNYLICSRTDYDGTQIRAYKSFEDYRLFKDGHVLDLKVANVKSNDVESNDDSHTAVTVVINDVRPTQRNMTKLNSYVATKDGLASHSPQILLLDIVSALVGKLASTSYF